MNNQNEKRSDFNLVLSYIIILLIAIFIPPLYFLTLIILPIPVILYAYSNKAERLYLMVGVLVAITLILSAILYTVLLFPLFVTAAASGIAIGLAVQKNKSAYETWVHGIVGYMISLLFIFVFSQLVLDINWAEEIRQTTTQSLDQVLSIFSQLDPQLGATFESQFDIIKQQLYYMPNLIPVGMALFSIVFAFLALWLSYKLINRLHKQNLRFPPVHKLSFPVAIIWFYIIAMLIMLFENKPTSGIYIASLNVTSLISFLLIIQGFTFIFFLAHRKNMSKVMPILAVIVSIVFPPLLYVVRFVGLFDLALSVRKRMKKS